MRTNELIREIQRLPIPKRIYVVEKTIHSIRKHEDNDQMRKAADALASDYLTDTELTVFTNPDF